MQAQELWQAIRDIVQTLQHKALAAFSAGRVVWCSEEVLTSGCITPWAGKPTCRWDCSNTTSVASSRERPGLVSVLGPVSAYLIVILHNVSVDFHQGHFLIKFIFMFLEQKNSSGQIVPFSKKANEAPTSQPHLRFLS